MISKTTYEILLSSRYRDRNEAIKLTEGYDIYSFDVCIPENDFFAEHWTLKRIKLTEVIFHQGTMKQITEYQWIEDN